MANDFDWVKDDYNHLLGDYRVGEWNFTATVVDVNVETNRVVYHIWASRGHKGTFNNVNRGSMEISTLEEKLENGQWSKIDTVNESDFDWTDEAPMKYTKTEELEIGREYFARNIGQRRLNGGETFDAEGQKFVVTDIRTLPYMVEVIWDDMDDEISRVDWFSVLTQGEWEPILSNQEINESDFDWTETVSSNPLQWVQPDVTLDNVEKDEDGWPLQYGDGTGEIWVDFERFNNDERLQILRNIEKHLGTLKIGEGGVGDDKGVKEIMCTSNKKKGMLIHCGHEDNHYFSQENYVCCMGENYNEFLEYEREFGASPNVVDRPIVDGGLFLDKENLTEGFYYKGVNPTVDLIVIRGDKVLLIQRGEDAEAEAGKWALPGGFHDTNAKEGEEWKEDKESSLEAAKREVKEETGLDVDSISGLNFEMVGVYEGGGRDPRDKEDAWTRSTVYMVHIPEDEGHEVKGMDDAQRAEWVPLSLVLSRKLAFDHHKIIEKALTMNESDAFSDLGLLTESDDFQWVKDTPAPNPLHSDEWIVLFNNEREYEEVQRWAFSNGLCWDGHYDDNPEAEDCGEPWSVDGPTGFFFRYGEGEYNSGLDAYSFEGYRKDEREERIEDDFPNHTKYNWSDIRYLMNESNDFEWTDDVGAYVGVESLKVGDKIEVVVVNDNTNMFHGAKGKVVHKGISQWDNLPSVSVDWFDSDVSLNRTIFSTDDSKDQYRFIKEDLDWVKDVQFKVTEEYIRETMSNCEDVPVTNYNLRTNSPYIKRGKMNVYYHSMCPYWWDKLKDLPLDEYGRGKGEWFYDSDNGKTKVAVIMPERNGVTDIRGMELDDYSAITYDIKRISKYFNGESDELWIFLDDNGGLRYDLIPDHLVDEVRKGFEGVEMSRTLEESFEWTEEIPNEVDEDLWLRVAEDIDNHVSGPHSGDMRGLFGPLAKVLDKHNMDISDMTDFFMFPPNDIDGNDMTNYQLVEIHKDLIKIGVSLTPEQERDLNLESVNESEFEWMDSIKPSWLRVGQKFTNVNNYRRFRQYHPEGKLQVGSNTFEIYDINEKDGQQYLRFTHNDVMKKRNWERQKADEIGKNYRGLTFEKAKRNIDSGFWIPLTDCEFEASTHPNLVGKTKPDGTSYGHTYCVPDTSFEHMNQSRIRESEFDWTQEAPDYDAYRFFDVYTCGEMIYDEETGEDECVSGGGSYFLKIPKEEVEGIWDLEVGDFGGPGDEGLGIIDWGEANDKFDPDDYDSVEYVRELDREEFCQAVGFSNRDICPERYMNESDFDWTEQSEPITVGMRFKILGNDYPNQTLAKMEVVGVKNGTVYFQNKTNTDIGGDMRSVSLERAIQLVDEKYWIPHDEFNHGVDSWGGKLKESEFDWVREHKPWEGGRKYVIDFTTEDEDVSGYLGFGERKNRQRLKDMLIKLGYKAEHMSLNHCFYYLEDFKGGRVGEEKWELSFDGCDYGDLEEIYEIIREENYKLVTPTQFFDMVSSSIET